MTRRSDPNRSEAAPDHRPTDCVEDRVCRGQNAAVLAPPSPSTAVPSLHLLVYTATRHTLFIFTAVFSYSTATITSTTTYARIGGTGTERELSLKGGRASHANGWLADWLASEPARIIAPDERTSRQDRPNDLAFPPHYAHVFGTLIQNT